MMAYEGCESARDSFGKFINQFQPETKTVIRKLERILNKLYRQNLFLLFNETCLNEQLLPNYIYIYIYITSELRNRRVLFFKGQLINSFVLACCGADNRVGPANEFKGFMRASCDSQRQWRKIKGGITDTTKVTILLTELQTCM